MKRLSPLVLTALLCLTTACGDNGIIPSTACQAGSRCVEFGPRYATIQAAVNAACNGTNQGGVIIPAGTYVQTLSVPSNCEIGGAGMGQTIIQAPAASPRLTSVLKNADRVNGNTNITIHDLTLDANKSAQSDIVGPLSFNTVTKSKIYNAEIENGWGTGGIVWVHPGDNTVNSDCMVDGNYVHDNGLFGTQLGPDGIGLGCVRAQVTNNHIAHNSDSGIGLQGFGTDFVLVDKNTFENNWSAAFAAGAPSGAALGPGANSDITVSNNKILGSTNGYSIYFSQGANLKIDSNIITAVNPGTGFAEQIHIEDVTNCLVTNNDVGGKNIAYGIALFSSAGAVTEGCTLFGNTIRGQSWDGIRIGADTAGSITRNITLTKNIVINNGVSASATYNGINIEQADGATTQNITTACNVIADDQKAPTQTFGIAVLGHPNGLSITQDQFFGNIAGPTSTLPTDTVFSGNTFTQSDPACK